MPRKQTSSQGVRQLSLKSLLPERKAKDNTAIKDTLLKSNVSNYADIGGEASQVINEPIVRRSKRRLSSEFIRSNVVEQQCSNSCFTVEAPSRLLVHSSGNNVTKKKKLYNSTKPILDTVGSLQHHEPLHEKEEEKDISVVEIMPNVDNVNQATYTLLSSLPTSTSQLMSPTKLLLSKRDSPLQALREARTPSRKSSENTDASILRESPLRSRRNLLLSVNSPPTMGVVDQQLVMSSDVSRLSDELDFVVEKEHETIEETATSVRPAYQRFGHILETLARKRAGVDRSDNIGDKTGKDKTGEAIRTRHAARPTSASLATMNLVQKEIDEDGPVEPVTMPSSVGEATIAIDAITSFDPSTHDIAAPGVSLPLPTAYSSLDSKFNAMESAMSLALMRGGGRQCTFMRVCDSVQRTLRRNLGKEDLARVLFVYPKAYRLQYINGRRNKGINDNGFELSLSLGDVDNSTSENNNGGGNTMARMTRRKHEFKARLLCIVNAHHNRFLISHDSALSRRLIGAGKLRAWHPSFPLDNLPPLPKSLLPPPPDKKKVFTAKEALAQAAEWTPAVHRALEAAAAEEKLKLSTSFRIETDNGHGTAITTQSNSSATRSEDETDGPKKMWGVSPALQAKVERLEREKAVRIMCGDTAENSRLRAMKERCVVLVDTVGAFYRTQRKSSMFLARICKAVSDSSRSPLSLSEAKESLTLLTHLAPTCFSICETDSGSVFKLRHDHLRDAKQQVINAKLDTRI